MAPRMHAMRRFVLILLMFVLPLQFSWAAVAGFCEIDSTAGGLGVIGYHVHEHAHEHAQPQSDAAQAGSLNADVDRDCGPCHGHSHGSAAMLGLPPVHVVQTSDRYGWHTPPSLPDPVPDELLRPPLHPLA